MRFVTRLSPRQGTDNTASFTLPVFINVPHKPFHECAKRPCRELTRDKYCAKHRDHDAEQAREFDRRRAHDPLRREYNTPRWQATRMNVLLRDIICQADECNQPATVADHVIPARVYVSRHGGDRESFYDESNLQGLCKSHHDQKTALECGFAGAHE